MDMGEVNKAKSGLKMLDVPTILLIFSAQNSAQTSSTTANNQLPAWSYVWKGKLDISQV